MPSREQRSTAATAQLAVLLLVLSAVCVCASFVLATHNPLLVTGVVVAIALFIFSFLSPHIALYLLIFSMLLSPEFGARDYTGRGFTLRFEDLLLLIMGFAWLAKSAVFKGVGLIPRTPLNRPIIFYILACAFATLGGIMCGTVTSPMTGIFFVLKYFEYFVIFFITVNSTQTRDQVRRFLWAIFITYVIVLTIALLQIPQGVRITAPFEGDAEPNTLGGYLLIMFCLTILLYFNINGKFQKVAVAFLGAMCLAAILYTLSRSTWLGFLPMYIALIFLTHKRNVLIAVAIVSLLMIPFLLPKAVIERFTYTFTGDAIGKAMEWKRNPGVDSELALNPNEKVSLDSSTLARFRSMHLAFHDFQKKPILGYGATGHQFIDAQFFRVLIETGLAGLITFLFLMWRAGKTVFAVWKEFRHDPLYNIITASTFCALIGLLFQSVGTNTFIIVRIMEPFWCLVGLCVAIPIVEGKPWYVRKEDNMRISGN